MSESLPMSDLNGPQGLNLADMPLMPRASLRSLRAPLAQPAPSSQRAPVSASLATSSQLEELGLTELSEADLVPPLGDPQTVSQLLATSAGATSDLSVSVRPRWPLAELPEA